MVARGWRVLYRHVGHRIRILVLHATSSSADQREYPNSGARIL